MSLAAHLIVPSNRTIPVWARVLAAPVVAVITLVGLWFFAGQLTNDFKTSMALTVVWFGLAGLISVWTAQRWRGLAVPVLAAFVFTSGSVGGYLAWSTLRDVEVNEQVAVGVSASELDAAGSEALSESVNVEVLSGEFVGQAHGASGRVAVVELGAGGRVLTFTDLETDNGPDLRVYLVAGAVPDGGDAGDFVDLGGLKGNRGNQQYEIPDDVDLARYGSVSIWCRAFSVSFGMATLAPS